MQTEDQTSQSSGRRAADRRQQQLSPLPFPDRRKGERRSGEDRRAAPR
ncbi:MAG TPA: hypothetical protein PLL44_05840 [Novosphingobium sp.]|jgi:hypothetical protein|nr:hypothetical protein [Novosphingobium sp.]HQN53935.1 hypothetical protein [Novosphingobium sp.]HQQ08394.1 hypothetical protein [Novosphingobium sp.]